MSAMRRASWAEVKIPILFVAVIGALTVAAIDEPMTSPVARAQGTPTAPPDSDRDTLIAFAASPEVGWTEPLVEVTTEEDGTIRTTAVQAGDGTSELARISRYTSNEAARAAFGDRRPVFFGMQARRGRDSAHADGFYSDSAFIEFKQGSLIFRIETRYERAACGFAREPDDLAERLARQAEAHALISPLVMPTPSCETKLTVQPMPCAVGGETVRIRGETSILDCDVVVDGGSRRVQSLAVTGRFRIDVPLTEGAVHRMFVGHLLCRIECEGGTFYDVHGAPLQVWRVEGIAAGRTVFLPWSERAVR